jgi:phenylalanyl-tRNA synthetase alpha chain
MQNKWADVNVLKIGQGKAFKNKWIRKDGDRLVRLVDSVQDQTRGDLQQIQQTGTHRDEEILKDLKKRKLCDRSKTVYFSVQKGPQFSMEVRKQATDITADSLVNEAWKSMSFKRYNFDTAGIPPSGGYLHPLMKVREEFRQIFFEMGQVFI